VNSLSQALDDKKHDEGDDEGDDEHDADCSPPPTVTPEPASLALVGTGVLVLAGVGYMRRRHDD
jgi:hypothetical protein